MHDYLMADYSELRDVVLDVPFIPTSEVKDGEMTRVVPKTRQQYNERTERRLRKATRLRSCWYVI